MMMGTCRRHNKTTSYYRRHHDDGLSTLLVMQPLSSSSSSMMMMLFVLFTFHFIANVDGRSVTPVGGGMDEGGSNDIVKCFTKVPNVLGWVDSSNDPPILVDSNVPVSILRYNDNIYLDGGQPIFKEDMYIVVKKQGGGCSEDDGNTDNDEFVEIQY